ncbi:MAG: S1C family serine protease [Acidimicrobiales bacterium]
MDSGGAYSFGELPDDFGAPGVEGEADAPLRGWIPPDDRLWRHPSELRAAAAPDAAPSRRPGGRVALVAVGVCSAALVAGVAVAVTSGGSPLPAGVGRSIAASETSLVTVPGGAAQTPGSVAAVPTGPEVVQIVAAMRPSLVVVRPSGSTGGAGLTGVVLPGGDLVVTAAAAAAGMSRVDVLTSDGRRHQGQVVGVDERAGVAVVHVAGDLQPADFADEAVQLHQLALTACLCKGAAKPAAATAGADVAVGMVRQVGTAATLDGGPSLVDAIEAEVPLGASSWGGVLLDDQGEVVGLLDGERNVGNDMVGYFVPSSLVVAVAEELAGGHGVTRGWLGVVCVDDSAGGATVTTVLPGSPAAAAGLRPGDVVEAVDSHAVGSLADLQARLYTASPGTKLLLTVRRSGQLSTTPVTVAASPS